jgi:recombination protein RecA
MERSKLNRGDSSEKTNKTSDYFAEPKIEFIKTGCVVLDCVLGGGWPIGRVSNIVGDKAVGKTLLAIEACANFARQHPEGLIFYREAEAAFDVDYAATLGLPVDRVDFGEEGIGTIWDTVEEVFEDLSNAIEAAKEAGQPALYIVDSLDALSDSAEMERDIDKGTYGTGKAKMMSTLFRQRIRGLKEARMALVIISQVRDKIGFGFGDKHTRSGGRALDFYASIALWLSLTKTITKTHRGIKRPTGIRVQARCKKNKIAMPHRECEFPIKYAYGIDELPAILDWLDSAKALKELPDFSTREKFENHIASLSGKEYSTAMRDVRKVTRRVWREVEKGFIPEQRKYL